MIEQTIITLYDKYGGEEDHQAIENVANELYLEKEFIEDVVHNRASWMVQGELRDFQLANCMDCPSANENKGKGIGCCTLISGPRIKNNKCLSKLGNIKGTATSKRKRKHS